MIKVGCGALIVENGKVLLVKRSKDSHSEPGKWARPGGRIELREKAEDAVVRECREEIGVDIEVLGFHDMSEHFSKDHWIALGYLARIVKGTPKNLEPDKHDEVKWWPLDDLPELASFTKDAVEKYKTNNFLNK